MFIALALGSNLGNKRWYIDTAIQMLDSLIIARITAKSKCYTTKALTLDTSQNHGVTDDYAIEPSYASNTSQLGAPQQCFRMTDDAGVLHGSTQQDYMNMCVIGDTTLTPEDLLYGCKMIERKLGRMPDVKWASRVIDIDIIFYGDEIIMSHNLIIPHTELLKRRFVLEPLHDMIPEYRIPGTNKTISSALSKLL